MLFIYHISFSHLEKKNPFLDLFTNSKQRYKKILAVGGRSSNDLSIRSKMAYLSSSAESILNGQFQMSTHVTTSS